jgi:uncharacterized protein YndB with AHSA1/START domain
MVAPAFKLTGRKDEVLKVEVDPRVGGKFSFVVRRDGQELDHTGEYLAFDRPRRLVFTWGVPAFSSQFSKVALDFQPDGEGTLVSLTFSDVPEEYRERTQQGWTNILQATGELDGLGE